MTSTLNKCWRISACSAVLCVGVLSLGGCATEAQTGGFAGAGIGALAGQAIGHDTESTLIGAAVGGAAGYIIGNERDKMKQQQSPQQQQAQTNQN